MTARREEGKIWFSTLTQSGISENKTADMIEKSKKKQLENDK